MAKPASEPVYMFLKGKFMSLRLTSSALALMAFAVPAVADVTPEEVWQNWLDYYTAAGYEVKEGSRDLAGETLTVKDVVFSATNDGSTVEISTAQVEMQATGDGKVRTVYADQMPLKISGKDASDKTFEVELMLAVPGNEMTSSGSAGDITHEFNYPTIDLSMDKVRSGEEDVAVPATLSLVNTTGTFRSVTEGDAAWSYDHKTENVTFKLDVDQPEAKVNVEGSIKGIEGKGNLSGAVEGVSMQENLSAALNAGLTMDGALKLGELAANFAFQATKEDGSPQQGSGKFNGGESTLNFAMAKDGLQYQGTGSNAQAELVMAPLPFPITYGIESSNFDIQFPVSKSDDAQPFKLAYSLAGLTIGDQVWDLFDPTKQLSRDPANLDVDLTGNIKVTQDFLDPAFAAQAAEAGTPQEPPFEPVDIVVNQIAVKAVGASIEATGNLKGTGTGGMEAPVGDLNVRYSGVAELVQTLAQMGLLPPQQVMGINAMIGAFGKEDPSAPGVRTTDLEFREDGSIFANGQQVQ